MSLYITSLNSGSNGNCYYVGNEKEAVLIDAGISCRETEKRLTRSGLSVQSIKAVFISHEHSDHIRGLEVFARKHRLPVYITPSTQKNSSLQLDEKLVRHFNAYEEVCIGQLAVIAFPKLHDACDPHSFTIAHAGVTIGVFTDIGYACTHVIENFKRCDAVFLEANYDETMLEEGHYPYHLKKRISGDRGHLSNKQALELFVRHKTPQLSHIILSHLSKENNSPQLVERLFLQHAGKTQVVVASREYETAVFCIQKNEMSQLQETTEKETTEKMIVQRQVVQMRLF